MPCSNCRAEKLFARGYCSPCYYRLWKTGDVNRKNMRNDGKCSFDGCQNKAFSKGLCQQHYNRAQHPMKATWKLLRSRFSGMYPAQWDAFDIFLEEVGERPVENAQLRRIDGNLPWSKANFIWIHPLGIPRSGDYTPEQRASYERRWRLKNKFGITPEQEEAALIEQDGKCAICGTDEGFTRKNGEPGRFHIDHCHETGVFRGLLCMNCNQGLGRLKDNPKWLRAAAAYLERHQPTLIEDAAE